MVGATLLTTLKAVSMFKRALRKTTSDPGGLGVGRKGAASAPGPSSSGNADATGAAGRRQTAPVSLASASDEAVLFDMEAGDQACCCCRISRCRVSPHSSACSMALARCAATLSRTRG